MKCKTLGKDERKKKLKMCTAKYHIVDICSMKVWLVIWIINTLIHSNVLWSIFFIFIFKLLFVLVSGWNRKMLRYSILNRLCCDISNYLTEFRPILCYDNLYVMWHHILLHFSQNLFLSSFLMKLDFCSKVQ